MQQQQEQQQQQQQHQQTAQCWEALSKNNNIIQKFMNIYTNCKYRLKKCM